MIRAPSGTSKGRALALVLGCALFDSIAAPRAQAQPTEPVRIEYAAPPECPTRGDFLLQLGARTRRARLAAPGELARTFTVTIRSETRRFVGRLSAEGLSETAQRELAAPDCGSVAASLALAVALAMDPDLPEPVAAPPASASPAPAEPTSRAPPPAPVHTSEPPRAAEPSPLVSSHRSPWRATAGIQALGVTGASPELQVVPRVFAELLRWNAGGWAPSFRLSFARGKTGSIDAGRGTAVFTWTAARAEGCVQRFELFEDTHLSPCLFVDAGTVRGEGAGVTVPRTKTLPWVAPGALARLDQELFRHLMLEIQAGVFIPLDRGEYHFDPDPVIFETPAVGAEVALGTGVRFP